MAPYSKPKTPSLFRPSAADDDDDFQHPGCPPPPPLSQITTNTPPPPCCGSQSQPLKKKPFDSTIVGPSKKRPKASISGKENHRHGLTASPFHSKPPRFEPLLPTPPSTSATAADSTAELGCCSVANRSWIEEEDCPHNNQFPELTTYATDCGLDSMDSIIDCSYQEDILSGCVNQPPPAPPISEISEEKGSNLFVNQRGCGYASHSVESRLLKSIGNTYDYGNTDGSLETGEKSDDVEDEFEEPCTQLDVLLKLCSEKEKEKDGSSSNGTNDFASASHGRQDSGSPIHCPLCGADISGLAAELQQLHTNDCLDKEETLNVGCPNDDVQPQCHGQVVDSSPIKSRSKIADVCPVLEWLRSLGLGRYEEIFVQEEIDWDTLQWLTEEDLLSIGVTALGPRKKIVHALSELRKQSTKTEERRTDVPGDVIDETGGVAVNKLITDYFPGSVGHRKKDSSSSSGLRKAEKRHSDAELKQIVAKKNVMNKKLRDIPAWCCIPGTPFRVDSFKYLRRDCSHWFLTHFHIDHYQGLSRSFSHGKIYCSLITAKLVNMKLGIPWEKLQVLPINQKISISGIDVTCFDANHCPGSILILFEPPNGKAVLHTGDFRFCEDMTKISALQMCCIQTLILDTTYCNPQYDFPKQEDVIQFVVEAIQAEAFNPKTLFLIGSYTIGKERLFLEVARVLRKKVYVTAAKLRLLECLGLSVEDMQWFTINEEESHIHVVPMWTLASFKRLKCISSQYSRRFSLIVAFSPTGWTFGKGKKKSSGRRWQQGTIVRYEVPYSEHCSFTELKEFVKFISPENIVPSVNNNGPESANAMVSLLLS